MATKRHRLAYGFGIALVIAAGLVWRSSLVALPAPVSKYGGDALWSLVVFLGFGFLFPRLSTRSVVFLALLFSFAVETSQLYHAPWIEALRQTRLGALVLGSVFNWPDFAAYALGVMLGWAGETACRRSRPVNDRQFSGRPDTGSQPMPGELPEASSDSQPLGKSTK